MKYLTLILSLVLAGGLLVSSQAVGETLTGEQLHQWQRIQERMDTEYQMQKLQLNMGQVTEMQRLLSIQGYDLGYDRGALSGILDEQTKAAIGAFQKDHGLVVTNMPNDETMRALERTTGSEVFFGLSPEFDSTGYTNDSCCP
jgi:peptidoglycan hydrolase-like protein with peptidoglycan-binding domain